MNRRMCRDKKTAALRTSDWNDDSGLTKSTSPMKACVEGLREIMVDESGVVSEASR